MHPRRLSAVAARSNKLNPIDALMTDGKWYYRPNTLRLNLVPPVHVGHG